MAQCCAAAIGDAQIGTDHLWYPGELAISTFNKLFATQASQFEQSTGRRPKTDEDKALAAWQWRNTHFAHGEEGAEDLWGRGFTKGDLRTREYWTGLFAHGFGLCGTTHSQWTAEMEHLFGHGRGRGVGVKEHNSFEVWLTGGAYGEGIWALLDHDISTVIFDEAGQRLLSIPEVQRNVKQLTDRKHAPHKQSGWLVCGLHPDDGGVYGDYNTAEYLAGYAAAPPMVTLRRGESLRRYQSPGLADGRTFVFWGRNYNTAGIPGPERSLTWVNQPEKMRGSETGAGFKPGQVRYANAVYTYTPNFENGDYREAVTDESGNHVTFEFYTPYIIAATPPDAKPWSIYEPGSSNGLVLRGRVDATVSVSVDQGARWHDAGKFRDGIDLTDHVKGHRQYLLRFHAGAKALAGSGLTIRTVCQANTAVLPRLKDGGSTVRFAASGRSLISAGPTKAQAAARIIDGAFNTPKVTLEIASPRGELALELYAAAHVASGNPPSPDVKYQIECSVDAGATWQSIAKDWTIPRRGDEPKDFWSQSFCYGSAKLPAGTGSKVQVRFHNSGRRNYLRAEAQLVYKTLGRDPVQATFAWKDDSGDRSATHLFKDDGEWKVPTGQNVRMLWTEMTPVAAR